MIDIREALDEMIEHSSIEFCKAQFFLHAKYKGEFNKERYRNCILSFSNLIDEDTILLREYVHLDGYGDDIIFT